MRIYKTIIKLGIGVLLTVVVSGPAMALTNEDGAANVTWPGYNRDFVAGSDPVPNAEPVVIEIVLTEKVRLRDFYFEIPGLPNPSYFSNQKNASLSAGGQYLYPDSNTPVFSVETVPAGDYAQWSAYFFDASFDEEVIVGGGFYGVDWEIESITLTLAPGSIVQVNGETNVNLLQLTTHGIKNLFFEDITMNTPGFTAATTSSPETTSAPEPFSEQPQELAETGVAPPWHPLIPAVAISASLLGATMTMVARRRLRLER